MWPELNVSILLTCLDMGLCQYWQQIHSVKNGIYLLKSAPCLFGMNYSNDPTWSDNMASRRMFRCTRMNCSDLCTLLSVSWYPCACPPQIDGSRRQSRTVTCRWPSPAQQFVVLSPVGTHALSKGCHLDVVRGPSTPHDPESDAGGSLSSWQRHPSR
jgi:hypothetical protein